MEVPANDGSNCVKMWQQTVTNQIKILYVYFDHITDTNPEPGLQNLYWIRNYSGYSLSCGSYQKQDGAAEFLSLKYLATSPLESLIHNKLYGRVTDEHQRWNSSIPEGCQALLIDYLPETI